MKKLMFWLLLVCCMFVCIHRCQAEPVTMVILAPIALEAAKQASPYVISSLQSGGRQMLEIGQDLGNFLRLPLGILQATAGIPLGMLGEGLENITIGIFAPFQLIGDILILPLSFFGAGGG